MDKVIVRAGPEYHEFDISTIEGQDAFADLLRKYLNSKYDYSVEFVGNN